MKKIFLVLIPLFFVNFLMAQENNTPAIFPGGDAAWSHYLDTAFSKQAMVQQMSKKDFERFGKTQKVVYYFSILADGTIGLINIEGAASQAVRNEIQRVLKNAPMWTPATLDGKPSTYRKKQISTFTFD